MLAAHFEVEVTRTGTATVLAVRRPSRRQSLPGKRACTAATACVMVLVMQKRPVRMIGQTVGHVRATRHRFDQARRRGQPDQIPAVLGAPTPARRQHRAGLPDPDPRLATST